MSQPLLRAIGRLEIVAEEPVRPVTPRRVEDAPVEKGFVVDPHAVASDAAAHSEGQQYYDGGRSRDACRAMRLEARVEPGDRAGDRDHRADAGQHERAFGDDNAAWYEQVADREQRQHDPDDAEGSDRTAAPAGDRQSQRSDQEERARQLDQARSFGHVDVRRRVLRHQPLRPEQQTKPLRRRADHRQEAISGRQVQRLEWNRRDETTDPTDRACACPQERDRDDRQQENRKPKGVQAIATREAVGNDQQLGEDQNRWQHDRMLLEEAGEGVERADREPASRRDRAASTISSRTDNSETPTAFAIASVCTGCTAYSAAAIHAAANGSNALASHNTATDPARCSTMFIAWNGIGLPSPTAHASRNRIR